MKTVLPTFTPEDLAFAEQVRERLGQELGVIGDADIGPKLLTASLLSHARNVREVLDGLLPKTTTTDALGELKAEFVRQVRAAFERRWPQPPGGVASSAWRQKHLSQLERNLVWAAVDRTNRRGLEGLAFSLQKWSDHAHRLFLNESRRALANVRCSAPPCREIEELGALVAGLIDRVARGIRYPECVHVEWPEEACR